jgi:hypothetical protein
VAYALHGHSRAVLLTHGLEIGVALQIADGWRGLVSYRLAPAVTVAGTQARLRVAHRPLSVGLQWSHAAGGLNVGVMAWFSADATSRTFRWRLAGDTTTRRASHTLYSASALPCLHFPVSSNARVEIAAGAELVVNRLRYVWNAPEDKDEILVPWRVQPRLLVGVSANFL